MGNSVPRPVSGPLVEVWDLWFALNYLHERLLAARTDRERYVPADEYNTQVQAHCRISVDVRQNLLTCLRKTRAIGVTNLTGSTNKKYFITELGITMLHKYEQELGVKGDE